MLDGKICNALSESSSMKCYLCGASPTEMNNLAKCISNDVITEYIEFGLSPLHAKIRFSEYFLHLSYKSEIKMWQVRGSDHKIKVMKRKQKILKKFREKMGIIVDKSRDGAKCSSNDGNVTRKFFSNPNLASKITGINENLIYRCATILQAASGYKININKFNTYALDTAKELINEYPCYYLPATVHKVLTHGSIGELSEEAAESNNTNLKKRIKTFFARVRRPHLPPNRRRGAAVHRTARFARR